MAHVVLSRKGRYHTEKPLGHGAIELTSLGFVVQLERSDDAPQREIQIRLSPSEAVHMLRRLEKAVANGDFI